MSLSDVWNTIPTGRSWTSAPMPLAGLEHAVAPRLARDGVGGVDAQAVAVELEPRAGVRHPDPRRRDTVRQRIEGLGGGRRDGRLGHRGGRRLRAGVRGEGQARRGHHEQRGRVDGPAARAAGGVGESGGAGRERPRGSMRRAVGPPRRRSPDRRASAAGRREPPAAARRGLRNGRASGAGSAASRRDPGGLGSRPPSRRSGGPPGAGGGAGGRERAEGRADATRTGPGRDVVGRRAAGGPAAPTPRPCTTRAKVLSNLGIIGFRRRRPQGGPEVNRAGAAVGHARARMTGVAGCTVQA